MDRTAGETTVSPNELWVTTGEDGLVFSTIALGGKAVVSDIPPRTFELTVPEDAPKPETSTVPLTGVGGVLGIGEARLSVFKGGAGSFSKAT